MSSEKPITIVGGGLAGLALGIGLRQRGVPAVVWEAGRYPRHRVCGEFISGRGLEALTRLGLRDKLLAAGAREAQSVMFFSERNCTGTHALPRPALCLSRYALDELLAQAFCDLDGELRENERWRGDFVTEGIVRATGRRIEPRVQGWRWLGLKAHAVGVEPAADLEVHVWHDGYVGICRLADSEVNVCGLFRRHGGERDAASRWEDWLRGPANSQLAQRLRGAVFDAGSFCAVAGLSLQPRRAVDSDACCIGDALTMIPPVTGNGMSMAFESAELAMEPLAQFSRADIPWTTTRQMIARNCDQTFARRLRWARWAQKALLSPVCRPRLIALASRWTSLWRILFTHTR